jgi:hypothetical protein
VHLDLAEVELGGKPRGDLMTQEPCLLLGCTALRDHRHLLNVPVEERKRDAPFPEYSGDVAGDRLDVVGEKVLAVASALPYTGYITVGLTPQGARTLANRSTVAALTGSAPLKASRQLARSSAARFAGGTISRM